MARIHGGRLGEEQIAEEIATLRGLDASALRLRWRQVTGKSPAVGLKGDLLLRALAQVLQEQAFGGLSIIVRKQLAAIAARGIASDSAPDSKASPRRKLMPGAKLLREWQGKRHEVIVIPGGFLWQGNTFTSLSTVAKAITGTSWNGWVFFGAKRPCRRLVKEQGDRNLFAVSDANRQHSDIANVDPFHA